MDRVAIVAPDDCLRAVLVAIADAGIVELDLAGEPARGAAGRALQSVRHQPADRRSTSSSGAELSPVLLLDPPDVGALAQAGRIAELAGEAELEQTASLAFHRHTVAAFAAWCPSSAVSSLAERLAPLGGGVARLPAPAGSMAPTLVQGGRATHAFQPLIDTYGTVPYRDINPSALAGLAYVAMFGMMFGDVGHGLLLLGCGFLLRLGRPRVLARFASMSPFVIGAGLASMAFGFAYGEAFGPTGLAPVLWLRPLDHPTTLLAVAIAIGATLLAAAYVLATINRWREAGPPRAMVAMAGGAGAAVYLGLAVVVFGWYTGNVAVAAIGGVVAVAGLALGYRGCLAEASGPGRTIQAAVELFDSVIRIGSNTVSFARLAAFGLTHAALGYVVWRGTVALGGQGVELWPAAALVFILGNAAAFALEALVAGVQALRLEYYELFSRIFTTAGRAFRPWCVPTLTSQEASCSPG
jgi:V/A-type H+-transporting ATPase subunit I